MPCRTIAVANQKGGTGKTATTLSLGVALARRGRRILLMDSSSREKSLIQLSKTL